MTLLLTHLNYMSSQPYAIWPIVTSSTKPEAHILHNILHYYLRRTEPWQQVTPTENLVKFGLIVFSELELTFRFAICCCPSVCLSVVSLSVVCNVRAPYSGGSNFRQYFYGVRYLGHPLTSTENFTEIVPGEPLRRGS